MAVHLRTTKEWRYNEDAEGNTVKTFPPHRTYSVEDDVGLLMIADGAAELTVPLTAEQEARLEVLAAAAAGDEKKVAALMAATDKKKK